ncbi:MAG TPA: hypothetical protein VF487_07625 [Chitinophagaceae bacterium]
MPEISLKDVEIRTRLNAGDLGYIVHRRGVLYKEEYGYRIEFEMYVAVGNECQVSNRVKGMHTFRKFFFIQADFNYE